MFEIFTKEGLISFLYVLPALLFSLAIHEFAHAYSAYKLGDRSQKMRGRLTLNPLASIDWMGFISIVLFGFGWGKPVIVDDSNFKNRARDNAIVSFAGPLANFIMAVVFTIILKILAIVNVVNFGSQISQILVTMLTLAIQFNVVFAVFNMLPIPPFDGSKVLFYFLPQKYKKIMYTLEKYSFYILLILLITDLHVYIITPFVNIITKFLSFIMYL